MGKHKEWRKIVKKLRRKRIRTQMAQQAEALEKEEEEKRKLSPNYEKRLAEERALEIVIKDAEMKELEEKLIKWEEEEERVREETKLREILLKQLEEKKEKKRIEKIKTEEEEINVQEEKQNRIRDNLYAFASGAIDSLPNDMLVNFESQPGREVCPFYSKVAACRFYDSCTRNHIRPSVSKILLFPGFYMHCSMAKISHAEYDTDMSLEYDDKETYAHFLEFFQDLRSEFEKYGRLTHLVVCANQEPHLRGNVYVAYDTEKETMAAFLKFNKRYYAGRAITCFFVNILSWKSAICGLYYKQTCPKGDACNFLHAFKTPGPPFYKPPREESPEEWRWSLSPEERKNPDDSIYDDNNRNRRTNKRRSRSPYRRQRSSERSSSKYSSKLSRSRRSKSRESTSHKFVERTKSDSYRHRDKSSERSNKHHSDKRSRDYSCDRSRKNRRSCSSIRNGSRDRYKRHRRERSSERRERSSERRERSSERSKRQRKKRPTRSSDSSTESHSGDDAHSRR